MCLIKRGMKRILGLKFQLILVFVQDVLIL